MISLRRMDEEVARWAFEVHLRTECAGNWTIAFTNPTAGPWKTVTAPFEDRRVAEVHRFGRTDRRPDIIAFSDSLGLLLVVEAKDEVSKLLVPTQVVSTVEASHRVAEILAGLGDMSNWGRRAGYQLVIGLLWGGVAPMAEDAQGPLVVTYFRALEPSRAAVATVQVILAGAGERITFRGSIFKPEGLKLPCADSDFLGSLELARPAT